MKMLLLVSLVVLSFFRFSPTCAVDLDTVLERLIVLENKGKVYEDTIAELKQYIKVQDQRIARLEGDSSRKSKVIAKLLSTIGQQHKVEENHHRDEQTNEIKVKSDGSHNEKSDLSTGGNNGDFEAPPHTSELNAEPIVVKENRISKKRFVVDAEFPVAFHAVVDGMRGIEHIGLHQKIVFETELLNLGSGYHSHLGVFVAPIKGVYVFSVSIFSHYITSKPVEIGVSIMKNGTTVLGRAYAHGDSGRHDQGSVTVTTQLEANDEIWVENYHIADDAYWGDRFDSFTGFLLLPLVS